MHTEKWPSGMETGQELQESQRDIPAGNMGQGKVQSPRGEDQRGALKKKGWAQLECSAE